MSELKQFLCQIRQNEIIIRGSLAKFSTFLEINLFWTKKLSWEQTYLGPVLGVSE